MSERVEAVSSQFNIDNIVPVVVKENRYSTVLYTRWIGSRTGTQNK